MLSVPYLICYLVCGCMIVRWLLPRHPALNRLWLGGSLGVLLMMWLPALFAMILRFSVHAHLAALCALAMLTGLAGLLRSSSPAKPWDSEERRQLLITLAIAVPLTALFTGLQITHVYRVNADGGWTVGQATFGDLPMHTAFITNFENAPFPPDYPMYPGHRLSYPFLADSLSTSFLLMGMSLQAAVIVSAVVMFFLTVCGVTALGRELSLGKRALIIGVLFFFLNGGLGFLYDFDQAAGFRTVLEEDGEHRVLTLAGRMETIMDGYYQTPVNRPEDNLRWSNVIADLFLPQRTFLGGYSMAIPCFYLLFTTLGGWNRDRCNTRALNLLGLWAGLLPLVHTHSFLALGLCSAGLLLHDMIFLDNRLFWLKRYLLYALLAVLLAAPQLICFTFRQTFAGEEGVSFVRFQFNWVNNPDGLGMRDFYLWFWIKNAGLPFILVLFALFDRDPMHRRILFGAGMIWLAAELVVFQPNEYDNNKLFYLAWLQCGFVAADTLWTLFDRLKGMAWRGPALAGFLAVCFLSASLSLAREWKSGLPLPEGRFLQYQSIEVFSPEQLAAADFIRKETDRDAIFLTAADTHMNPVDSVAGRHVVCGPDLWLWWHGFNTNETKLDIKAFYANPAGHADVVQKYGADYIYYEFSYPWQDEFRTLGVDFEGLCDLYETVYAKDGIYIFRVPEG
ncbi:MAG: hypothetical protein IJK28_02045 [Clostridia bacterium]|nr:hypothetical protein [Clostridia bacterium]